MILEKESTVSLMESKGMLYFIYTVVASGDCKVQFYSLAASTLNIQGKEKRGGGVTIERFTETYHSVVHVSPKQLRSVMMWPHHS